jgi:hypothetical protein
MNVDAEIVVESVTDVLAVARDAVVRGKYDPGQDQ